MSVSSRNEPSQTAFGAFFSTLGNNAVKTAKKVQRWGKQKFHERALKGVSTLAIAVMVNDATTTVDRMRKRTARDYVSRMPFFPDIFEEAHVEAMLDRVIESYPVTNQKEAPFITASLITVGLKGVPKYMRRPMIELMGLLARDANGDINDVQRRIIQRVVGGFSLKPDDYADLMPAAAEPAAPKRSTKKNTTGEPPAATS